MEVNEIICSKKSKNVCKMELKRGTIRELVKKFIEQWFSLLFWRQNAWLTAFWILHFCDTKLMLSNAFTICAHHTAIRDIKIIINFISRTSHSKKFTKQWKVPQMFHFRFHLSVFEAAQSTSSTSIVQFYSII